jgi:Mn2+/Fe2+ NRAMP family transporter
MDTVFGAKQFWIGSMQVNVWSVLIGGIAIILLMSGSYKVIEKAMIVLVILMSILFLITAIIIGPPILQIVNGMFIPTIPSKSILTIVGLIGTTVVPYNLFLHASAVSKRWHKKEDLSIVRFDTFVSIILGGIISMAIIITSAGALGSISNIANGSDLAVQLEPLLGEWAKYCLAGGLFAAGITSSITAPLAAAFATAGILGKPTHLTHPLFRGVMVIIIVIGIIFSSLRYSPVTIIQFAQFANGLLLPVIGIFLVWIMNRKELLGAYINTRIQNILGLIVIGVTILLGMKSIGAVLGLF